MSRTVQLLLVEDDEELRAVLLPFLTEEGYGMHEAASLAQAFAVLEAGEEAPFDLIISSLLIPDLASTPHFDPLEAVTILRERATPTPVGLITAWTFQQEESRLLDFAFLLPKPFDLDDLTAAITSVVGVSGASQDLSAQDGPTGA